MIDTISFGALFLFLFWMFCCIASIPGKLDEIKTAIECLEFPERN